MPQQQGVCGYTEPGRNKLRMMADMVASQTSTRSIAGVSCSATRYVQTEHRFASCDAIPGV